MEKLVQLTISGVADGAILALVALGFVLIYRSSAVINFAQGELLMVGAYLSYATVQQLALPWPIGVPIAMALGAIVGVLIEHVVLRSLTGAPVISLIMVTIGLSAVLRAVIGAIWGTAPLPVPAVIPDTPTNIGGALIGANKLWAIGLSVVLLGILALLLRGKQGIAMRAVAQDRQAARSMGISITRVWAVSWAIAAITAAVAGMLLVSIFGGVSADISRVGLLVFPVVLLGGLDSLLGAIVGGVVLGLLRAYAGGYLPPDLGLGEVVPFGVLLLILLLRPSGMFGQRAIERV